MSHEEPLYDSGGYDGAARRHLDVIEHVTGSRPPTCPWRAMYHPLVQEVLQVMALDENGNLAIAVGNDPPGLLVDAISVYKLALGATRAEEAKLRAAKAKREREARQS